MVDNLDEIIKNAYNTKNEDARHNNFASFNRGYIDVRIGNKDYSIEVVTGISNANNEIFYDIVSIKPTTIKRRSIPKVSSKRGHQIRGTASSNNRIHHLSQDSNGKKHAKVGKNESLDVKWNKCGRNFVTKRIIKM